MPGTREYLRSLLSEVEYDAARRTTINAHYTDAAYVQAMWSTVQELGFTGAKAPRNASARKSQSRQTHPDAGRRRTATEQSEYPGSPP